jgi:acyl-CoA synthetase (AMP-forming)/AMP-acid ligase II
MAITDVFDRGWRAGPDRAAFIAGKQAFTYREIGELSCRIANTLLASGQSAGLNGAVLSPNDPTAWACVLGMWRAGMAWVPLNPANPPEESQRMLEGFDCELLFCHSALLPSIQDVLPKVDQIKQVIIFGPGSGRESEADLQAGLVRLEHFIANASSEIPVFIPDIEAVAAILPTGGTTGAPKGAMNTHRSLTVSAQHHMFAASYSSDERPVFLLAAPMTHAAGTMTLPCSARGGTVVVMERLDPIALLDLIEEHRVTEVYLPPTVIYRLMEISGIEKRDFSSLKYLVYGGAPMSTEKLRRAIEVFGPVLHQGYGQAEAPSAIAFMRPDEHFRNGEVAEDARLSAAGRPAPMIRVEILDEGGSILPVGETGEVCVRGDLLMAGYYKAPDKTAETIVDGWLHTGDIGFLDAEGFLHITDRKKDMIISGGFNVYPSEVEQVIWTHPAVQDCAVIGAPHPEWGEAVTAVVELNPGAQLTEADLIAHCRAILGGIRTPKKVLFVDALPRSANGKVLKKDIREPFWRDSERKI